LLIFYPYIIFRQNEIFVSNRRQDFMGGLIQVSITAKSQEEGQRIVDRLLETRLAACGQLFGPIQSTYWWQGRIETAREWMCLVKSREEKFGEIVRLVKELHSYQVPEIIAVPLAAASDSYEQWLREELE
jgi:periplasmic divalent cation tolerance protein